MIQQGFSKDSVGQLNEAYRHSSVVKIAAVGISPAFCGPTILATNEKDQWKLQRISEALAGLPSG